MVRAEGQKSDSSCTAASENYSSLPVAIPFTPPWLIWSFFALLRTAIECIYKLKVVGLVIMLKRKRELS